MKKVVSYIINEENHQKAKIKASILKISLSTYIDRLIEENTKDITNDVKEERGDIFLRSIGHGKSVYPVEE